MVAETLRIGPQGRLVIPAALRRRLGFTPDVEVVAYVDDERLVLERRDHILTELQDEFADVPTSLTDELLTERRAEARRDDPR